MTPVMGHPWRDAIACVAIFCGELRLPRHPSARAFAEVALAWRDTLDESEINPALGSLYNAALDPRHRYAELADAVWQYVLTATATRRAAAETRYAILAEVLRGDPR